MTEIPANTPSPIGRTAKVFPGNENCAGDCEEAAPKGEAVAATEVVEVPALLDEAFVGDVLEVAGAPDADGVAEAPAPDEIVTELSPRMLKAAGNADTGVDAVLTLEVDGREAVLVAATEETTAVVADAVPPGGDALPLTGVRTQTVTCWTWSCPLTTMGVRVTVHVSLKVAPELSVIIDSVVNVDGSNAARRSIRESRIVAGRASTFDKSRPRTLIKVMIESKEEGDVTI